MIDELEIKNLALIEDASVNFSEGLTVISGETGAGKTALLSAFKLLLGERAQSSKIRQGSAELSIAARFFENEHNEAQEYVVYRSIHTDGRSRCKFNGSLMSLKELAQFSQQRIDLCSQHEHQNILQPIQQLKLLDAYLGLTSNHEVVSVYRRAYARYKDAVHALERLQEDIRQEELLEQQARATLEYLEVLKPNENEYQELVELLPRYENAELIVEYSEEISQLLYDDNATLDSLQSLKRSMEKLSVLDSTLVPHYELLCTLETQLEDFAYDMRRYRDRLSFDEEEMQGLQQRYNEYCAASRRFQQDIPGLIELYAQSRALIENRQTAHLRLEDAQHELNDARRDLIANAQALHDIRANGIPAFMQEIAAQLAKLEMQTCQIDMDIRLLEFDDFNLNGPDAVELRYAPGQHMNLLPLARIASGGELSRVVLALRLVLGDKDQKHTLVFDEVDAGVGGQTAKALGQVLCELSKRHQVIVVTHLAQIAMYADTHYRVHKDQSDETMPKTFLTNLNQEERVEELARMLSGETNEHACAHAQTLVHQAQSFKEFHE